MMNIMFCLLNESPDGAIESLRFGVTLKSYGLRISILKMYKGTELAKYAAANYLSEGVGEFTYMARDVHNDFDSIKNVQWSANLFAKLPFTLSYTKIILSQKWARVLEPVQVINHWQDIKFFHIPLWQAWLYFWNAREVFLGGMAREQSETYKAEDGTIRSTQELFRAPMGVIDWNEDRGTKETYIPVDE